MEQGAVVMPLEFTLEVLGETQIDRTFLRMADNARTTEKLWQEILKTLRLIEQVQFLTQGAHGSGGWPELAESTLKAKAKKGQQPWIERATEDLFNSLTQETSDSIADVHQDWLKYGTSIPYAIFQQTGTSRMPQRRLVQLTEIERKELTKMVQRFIMTGEV
jgi:phage gpG-like protein